MKGVLVDSNVLLDIFTEDPRWYDWSAGKLSECAEEHGLIINPMIYSEVSVRFSSIEELEEALPHRMFRRQDIPWEAAFLAGKCFLQYRRRGGQKNAPLPDFFIGAHAAVENLVLLTRDAARYQTYFPSLALIVPD